MQVGEASDSSALAVSGAVTAKAISADGSLSVAMAPGADDARGEPAALVRVERAASMLAAQVP